MKITLLQENLKQTVNNLKRVVPSKPQLPILSSFLIEAKDNKITISATDLYTGMRAQVPGTIEEEGALAVPAQVFTECVQSLGPGNVELIGESGSLKVISDTVKATIQCFSNEEYPSFPEKEGDEIQFAWEDFDTIIKLIPFATAKDDARPVLTSVLFMFSDQLKVVATDGFRLSFMSLDHQSSEELTLLIPGKALQEVHRIGSREEKKDIRWTFSPQLKQLFFAVDDVEMVIRLMEGEFPPYQKIMPESFTTEVVIDPDQLLASLKGAMVFAREASHIIKFSFDTEQLTISASSPTLGNHQSTVPIKLVSGQPNEIAFNVHYLAELIQTAKPKSIKLLMNESLQPAQFEIDDNPAFRYIVMPFRVNS